MHLPRFRGGNIIEKLCPDGMVFNDYSSQEEKCDLPFNLDCSARPKLRKYFYCNQHSTVHKRP